MVGGWAGVASVRGNEGTRRACATNHPVTGLIQQMWKCLAPLDAAYIVERFVNSEDARRRKRATGKLDRT